MKQVLHILKKDLRRYQWAWVALLAFAAIDVYLRGTTAGLMDTPVNKGLGLLSTWLGTIVFFVVVVMIVQEETLVDPDADWISRPVHRGALLTSKWLSLLLLLSISQTGEIFILVLNQGLSRLPFAIADILPALAMWQGQVFLSAQTRSLPRYLLLAVSLNVGLMLVIFLGVFAGESSLNLDIGILPPSIPTHIVTWIQTLFWLAAGGGILMHLYQTRRIAPAWGWLLGACVIGLLLRSNEDYAESFSMDGNEYVTLKQLETGGTIYADNQESTAIIGIFARNEAPADTDLWASVHNASLRSGDKDLPLEPYDFVQKYQDRGDGLLAITLGYLPRNRLAGLGEEITAEFSQSITLSKQVMTATIPLKEGAAHVAGGNRIAIQNFYHADSKLSVSVGAGILDYSLEPKETPRGQNFSFEPFDGMFSFSLADRDGKRLRDFDLSPRMDLMGIGNTANITVEMPGDWDPADYSVIIHRRTITKSAYSFTTEETSLLAR